MDASRQDENGSGDGGTATQRRSDRELVTTRSFDAPVRLVFLAWTTPDLFRKWWVPESFGLTLLSYEADIRTGGTYRLVFSHPEAQEPMEFHGTYLEVTPNVRLVWTNEEGGEAGQVTTVTFEEKDGGTLLTVSDLYPSKEVLDEALANGSTGALPLQFEALDVILTGLATNGG